MEIVLLWQRGQEVEGNGPDLPLPARDLTAQDLAERGITLEDALRSGHYALPTMQHQESSSEQ